MSTPCCGNKRYSTILRPGETVPAQQSKSLIPYGGSTVDLDGNPLSVDDNNLISFGHSAMPQIHGLPDEQTPAIYFSPARTGFINWLYLDVEGPITSSSDDKYMFGVYLWRDGEWALTKLHGEMDGYNMMISTIDGGVKVVRGDKILVGVQITGVTSGSSKQLGPFTLSGSLEFTPSE